jgi:signal transduction histidine kinase/GGDEF domain-containing protein
MKNHNIQVLVIEDSPGDFRLIQEMLLEAKDKSFQVELAKNLSKALERLKQGGIDVVLSDLGLPDSQGLATFEQLHTHSPDVPIVILTSTYDDETTAVKAVSKGAQDYLVKGQVDGKLVSRVLRYAVERMRLKQVKDEFVGTVSHELRTPMTSIREVISQTLDGILGETTSEQREFLTMALSDVDRLSRMIDDLLDISKLDAGKMKMKMEMCEMVALVLKIISSFVPQAKARGLEMKGSFSKEKIKAYVDKDRITQVFSNLIGNAVKFTQKGHIEISLVDSEDAVECSVSDTGPGIAKKDLPQLFDKFQQFGHPVNGEEKGTGLGLAISKGIVELHKGKIWVKSEVNVGTKFTFVLPKFTGKELISEGLKKAIKDGQALSVLIFDIKNFEAVQQKIGEERAGFMVRAFWELIKDNLRREGDNLGVEDVHTILSILPGTEKKNATLALERMRSALRGFLLKEGLKEEVDLDCEVVAYPDDGKTEKELLSKITDIMVTRREVYVTNQ